MAASAWTIKNGMGALLIRALQRIVNDTLSISVLVCVSRGYEKILNIFLNK